MFSAQDFAARLSTRQDQWPLLKDFIAEWHGPLKPGDGYPASELDAAEQRLGLKLPVALWEWYQLAGKREDVVATQNHLMRPQDLNIVDSLLVFHSENQDIIEWGIKPSDLHLSNPPVYLNDRGMYYKPQEPIRENETLSEFALQMVVCNTVITRNLPISSENISKTTIAKIEQEYIRFGFPDWHWPGYPVRFYGAEDTLAMFIAETPHDERFALVAASTSSAYWKAKELLELH